jgi:hypothetical protein
MSGSNAKRPNHGNADRTALEGAPPAEGLTPGARHVPGTDLNATRHQ